jgi:hypothetical protein
VSPLLIAILVFWTAALFLGIDLFAGPNALIYSTLAFAAASPAFAIFSVFEFGAPYTGVYKLSPAPLEQAIHIVDA